MLASAKRLTWLVVGVVALVLGGLGIVLPLLPTTPFILLAAFAFAQSSETLHQWLLDHNIFGPLIENWRRYRAISRRAKILSLASMLAIILISMAWQVPTYILVIQVVCLTPSAIFIATRPLPPDDLQT